MNTPQEFDELYRALSRIGAGAGAVRAALATIVRTRGSTFRRAGARMLVCADGTVVRGLSGGCPERDIIARAHGVIATGIAEIVRYDRESGFDVMLEMGCGGELEVLIEPIASGGRSDFIEWVGDLFARRGSGWLATVLAVDGACVTPHPLHIGVADGDTGNNAAVYLPVIGEGAAAAGLAADPALFARLRDIFATSRADDGARMHRFDLGGRVVDALVERLVPPHALVLIGANASSLALARLAVQLGWETTVVDPRPAGGTPYDWPANVRCMHADADAVLDHVAFDARTSVVIMTHHLQRDLAYLEQLKSQRLAYLGAIGSRERAARMRESGLAATRLHAPAGLDIGSETPEEIALAIAAEIVSVLAGRSGASLSTIEESIH